jgi:hypothetical protein
MLPSGLSAATAYGLPGQHEGSAMTADHAIVAAAYRAALASTVLTGAAIAAAAFLTVLFLPERRLHSLKG